MASHVCPWWVGYLLLSPMRRWRQSPRKRLGPFIREGMVVLEPGPGMGFFTLDVARMVGASGRVVAVDVQQEMLDTLRRRAEKAGLVDRIDFRLANRDRLGIDDLEGNVDLVLAIFVVHEMSDDHAFFTEARRALRPGGRLLLAEPKIHVARHTFERSVAAARQAGFTREGPVRFSGGRAAMLVRASLT